MSVERGASRVALIATLIGSAGLVGHIVGVARLGMAHGSLVRVVAAAGLLVTVGVLIAGSLIYQACRFGYLSRLPEPDLSRFRGARELFYRANAPRVAVLVPSFEEEPAVIRQTLLSVLFQDHPNRKVVLLIDNPPSSGNEEDDDLLCRTRALVDDLACVVGQLRHRGRVLLSRMQDAVAKSEDPGPLRDELATAVLDAANWIAQLRDHEPRESHADALLHDRVLGYWVGELSGWASWIRAHHFTPREFMAHCRKYAALFDVELSRFERKQYQNLSHEPNKAMNINAYLSLLGGRYVTVLHDDGQVLEPAAPGSTAALEIPDADYVVTVDADSLLHPHYVCRLVGELELPGHERTAVIQTPYSAIRGAPTHLERIAGATTDLQYNIHQGFTHWDATFWVGANAVLRASAIRAIATHDTERGWPITRYIQDRTVIEDTESSIDLVAAGWRLHNYPERLSWSATPPDFGALIIQRRRWANGGLIIAPKLFRLIPRQHPREIAVRAHYLLSPAASNLAVAALLLVPFGAAFNTWWLPLSAAPYFWLQHRDLRALGYKRADILRVWALNLLLLPVNLAGVFKSIQQAVTGRKIPFARTPKTPTRTPAAPLYVAAPVLAASASITAALVQYATNNALQAGFAALSAGLLIYALAAFIGPQHIRNDLTAKYEPAPTPTNTQKARLLDAA